MADFQRVVEFLRDLRQGALQEVTEEITQAATEYAALCISANERLRKSSTFLQQGLRTEALHLADETPNLLDLVAALDLPDPQTWAEFCQNNGLPVPPPLQLDRAQQLNDAYALDQPLEHLLSQHRLLALARGPIRERLSLLRQIAQVDAGNASWEKDIRVFERARLKELPSAFYNAVKNRDDNTINTLMDEIAGTTWLEPVPADLSTAVSDAFNRIRRASVEADLRAMVEPLRDAYAARSFQECWALVQQWKNAMETGGVTTISTELTDEIRPVVAFVQEKEKREEQLKKFREACRAFGRLLDMDVSDAQLESGYAKLQQFGEPIPEDLTARYNDKKAARRASVERKHKTRLIGIGATAAALVVVALVIVVMVTRSSDARQWATRIEQAASTKNATNVQTAQQLVAQLRKDHPSFLSEPAVAAAVRDAQNLQAEYDRDTTAAQGLLVKFDGVQKTAEPVAADPNASANQVLAAAGDVQDVLIQAQNAGDLSWVDSDKKYTNAASHLQSLLSRLQQRAAVAVRGEVDQLSAQVDAIPPVPANMLEADTQLAAAANRAQELQTLGGLDDQTKSAVAALADKVTRRRQSLDATRAMAGELDVLRVNSGTADDLKKALNAFIQKNPNDARTSDFMVAIGRLGLAKDAELWRDIAAGWAGQYAPNSAATAQKRIDAISAYLSAHAESPMAATANTYLDYLKHANDALVEKGSWQTGMGDLLSNPIMSELAYMQTSDGQKFYVLGDINRADRRMNNRVTVTFEALTPGDVTKKMLVAVEPPATLLTPKPVPTPHTKLVQTMVDQIKLIDAGNWDTWGMDATDTLLKNKQVEVVIKAILVQQLLKTEQSVAGGSGWGINDAYGQTLTELARQKPEQLPWTDPTRVSDGTLRALQITLDAVPSAASVKEKLAASKAAMFKATSFDVAGTGVLLKDDAGNWSVASRNAVSEGNLWTVVPGAGDGSLFTSPAPAAPATTDPAATEAAPAPAAPSPGTLVQIGAVHEGKFALYENAVRDLPQGTMVYITQP